MVVIILLLLSMAMTLRGNLVSGDKHLQISDTGNYQTCFDMNYNKGYADFLLNPLLSFGGRGNWGKAHHIFSSFSNLHIHVNHLFREMHA